MGSGSELGSDEYYEEEEAQDEQSALFSSMRGKGPGHPGEGLTPRDFVEESGPEDAYANDNNKVGDMMNLDEEEVNQYELYMEQEQEKEDELERDEKATLALEVGSKE